MPVYINIVLIINQGQRIKIYYSKGEGERGDVLPENGNHHHKNKLSANKNVNDYPMTQRDTKVYLESFLFDDFDIE